MTALTDVLSGTQPAGNHGSALELRAASKNYGTVQALTEVSLTIRPGEIVALLGPNGAGKTTAINLLLGLIRPDSGEALMFGDSPDSQLNRMRTGTLMQVSGIPETLSVQEHLEGFASYYPEPLDLHTVIRATGLSGLERRMYARLSGGQRQRLHLALALIGNPEILFLDEPTTGLDLETRRALWQLVREFSTTGRTVLLTTHYLEEADELADRIVMLRAGKIVADGTPAQIKASTAGRRVSARTTVSVEFARELAGVVKARREGERLELLVNNAEEITRTLLFHDDQLSDLEVTAVSLDEAFVSLTGSEEPR